MNQSSIFFYIFFDKKSFYFRIVNFPKLFFAERSRIQYNFHLRMQALFTIRFSSNPTTDNLPNILGYGLAVAAAVDRQAKTHSSRFLNAARFESIKPQSSLCSLAFW